MNNNQIDRLLIILCILILACIMLIGCGDYYEEGDEQGKQAMDLMTTTESILYKRVQDEWGQKRLLNVRNAIRNRAMKPDEDNIAFLDIAKVIKTNNDVTMVFESSWGTDTRNKYAAARWDAIDKDWFRQILIECGLGINNKHIRRQPEVKTAAILDVKSKVVKVEEPEFKETEVQTYELLDEDEIYELEYLIRDCDSAKNLLSKIVREGRPLVKTDKDELTKRAMFCKATQLRNSLEE